MRKKADSNYHRFFVALIDASDEFLIDPNNNLTYVEAIGAAYSFVRYFENHLSAVASKTDEGENDE